MQGIFMTCLYRTSTSKTMLLFWTTFHIFGGFGLILKSFAVFELGPREKKTTPPKKQENPKKQTNEKNPNKQKKTQNKNTTHTKKKKKKKCFKTVGLGNENY